MEFLMLNLMMAMFYTRLGEKIVRWGGAFQSADFEEALEHFPEHLLPARRKKRTYISSILSKNEVSRDDKYNRKLFLRVKHGHYVINPRLRMRVEGEWRRIYDLLSFDMIAHPFSDPKESAYWADLDFNAIYQQQIKRLAQRVTNQAEPGHHDEDLWF